LWLLGDIPKKGAKLHGSRECMVFEGQRLNYTEFNARINRLAHSLLSFAFDGSKHLAVLAENCPQFMEIYFAAAKAGYVTVPLNFRLANNELTHILKDAEAKILFYGSGYENIAREIAAAAGINFLVSMEGQEEGCLGYEDMLARSHPAEPEVPLDENQMVILMYTGGTTGLPKGVMLSHRNLLTAAIDLTYNYQFHQNEITCFVLPMFHASVWPLMCALIAGGKAAILKRPDLDSILALIEREKCTHINAVPTIYNWLMDHPSLDEFDLSSLKKVSYAGSPMAPELLKKMLQKFNNISFYQGYGLTEAAPTATFLRPEDHVPEGPPEQVNRLKSVGRELLMVELKLVRSDGSEVTPGEIGEILARGKNIMLGYWKKPKQTAETLRNGWLHTGDLGTVDQEGYIYLVDRKHDMIITGGENVYPREVEDILYEHPAVMEVIVIGVPDEQWGEAVKAVVVLRDGMSADEEELIRFVKSRLAGYKCPKTVTFTDKLPKTAVGKLLRAEVKKRYWSGRDRFIS